MSTRHLVPRQDKVSKALSLDALNEAVEMLPEVVPVGATGFVPEDRIATNLTYRQICQRFKFGKYRFDGKEAKEGMADLAGWFYLSLWDWIFRRFC